MRAIRGVMLSQLDRLSSAIEPCVCEESFCSEALIELRVHMFIEHYIIEQVPSYALTALLLDHFRQLHVTCNSTIHLAKLASSCELSEV